MSILPSPLLLPPPSRFPHQVHLSPPFDQPAIVVSIINITSTVLITWFEKVNSPNKIVNLLFTVTDQNVEMTVLWGS